MTSRGSPWLSRLPGGSNLRARPEQTHRQTLATSPALQQLLPLARNQIEVGSCAGQRIGVVLPKPLATAPA